MKEQVTCQMGASKSHCGLSVFQEARTEFIAKSMKACPLQYIFDGPRPKKPEQAP
jgi:hypothetical protein